jgi:hypothetical protein
MVQFAQRNRALGLYPPFLGMGVVADNAAACQDGAKIEVAAQFLTCVIQPSTQA